MTKYEICVHGLYTQLTDQQLDGIVSNSQHTANYWQIQGHQLTSGIRMQQQLIRVEMISVRKLVDDTLMTLRLCITKPEGSTRRCDSLTPCFSPLFHQQIQLYPPSIIIHCQVTHNSLYTPLDLESSI